MARKQIKYIHEGQYVAEVTIELIGSDTGWSPTMSLEDAYQLVRQHIKTWELYERP